MRVILETVQRGSRHWCAERVRPQKALGFAEKMATLYHADANAAQRAYAKRLGRANTTVLMFPKHAQSILWWLLVTPGEGLVHAREKLMDAHDKRNRLAWLDQYELVHEQRPRHQGGGRHWTWRLTRQRFARLKAAMRELAAAHGGHDRRDDLDAIVRALLRMPGFMGYARRSSSCSDSGARPGRARIARTMSIPGPTGSTIWTKGLRATTRQNR